MTLVVIPRGLASFAGNHYSVPSRLTSAHAMVRIRLGGHDACIWAPPVARSSPTTAGRRTVPGR